MKANYEDKIPKKQTTVNFGNLYDANKQIMNQEPVISPEILALAALDLQNWFAETYTSKYYMLLCHELRDYTVFNFDAHSIGDRPEEYHCLDITHDLIECLNNRGEILTIEQQPDGAWEIWMRIDAETFAYYLFPYGQAVLEYR